MNHYEREKFFKKKINNNNHYNIIKIKFFPVLITKRKECLQNQTKVCVCATLTAFLCVRVKMWENLYSPATLDDNTRIQQNQLVIFARARSLVYTCVGVEHEKFCSEPSLMLMAKIACFSKFYHYFRHFSRDL